ncbi:ATP-dependent 6-phosphofructokinase [Frankliniella fusca]|uniref:ATP-dependent 6-phosphofructokinase n=1 Tax=Frankliniella fusca TaxID=407009 RepID=A0AAE1H2N5_9NEOP|nr:ATP-dependent 6-phosphofructokinase [Frankliniella fusca]
MLAHSNRDLTSLDVDMGIGKENVLPTSLPFVRRTRSTKCLSPNRQVTPATSPFRLDPELNTVPVESDGNSSPSFDCTPKLRSSIQRKRPRRSPPVCSPPAHTPRTSPPPASDGPTGSASLTSAILSELGSTFQQGKSQSTSTAIPSSSGGLTGSASLTSTILSELGNPFQGESQSTSTAIPSSSVGPTGSASLTSAILSELESTFQQGKSQSTSTAIPSSSGGLTGSASLTSSSILFELGSTFQGESQSTSPSSSGVLTWQEETEGEESDKEADDQTGEQGESEQHDEEEEGQQHSEGEEEEETEQDSSEDEEEEDGPPRKRQRRYLRQPISQTRQARKTARNQGEEYVTSKGKTVPKKTFVPLRSCRLKCFSKVLPGVGQQLCDSVWRNLGDANARRTYITGQISKVPKQFEKVNVATPAGAPRKRENSFEYFVCLNGSNIKVCKGCFMQTYNVSRKFVEICQGAKLENPAGVPRRDSRGSASKSVEKVRLQNAIDHINSFPKYQSHYARQRTESKFLPNHLTEKLMYDEYCKKEDNPVSRWTYSRELKKLGLKFKPLHVDTCQRCDALDAAVKYSKTEQEKEENLLKQQLHHKKSQDAIDQKKADKAKAKTSETTETIAFDLQQCLPTPHLSTSIAKVSTTCGMKVEGEGGRGANQVGSALFHYISALPDQVERLILWSDTCAGQNKNGIINSALITALSQKKTLKFIDQKFLVSGHTHLECDSDHAIIENKKKHISEIHLPRDWYNLVRNASNKFTVQPLRQHQLDFKALHTGKGSPLVKRKVTTTKEKFVWKDVVWIQHRRDLRPGVVAFKKSFDEDEEFEYLDMRRYQRGDMVLSPKPAYDGPVKISAKKKKDLLSMLHVLDPECHPFYNSLLTDDAIPEDLDPDIPASSDDEDSEGE